jgi:hypothetical protein
LYGAHSGTNSKEQSKTLAEALGPGFKDFRKRVRAHEVKDGK